MEFLTELVGKMTMGNLFNPYPSTDFSYASIIFGFLVGLVVFSYIFDFIAKSQSDKFLRKAMRGQMGHIRWTFPLVGALLLLMRLEGVPFLSMKIFVVLYFLTFISYSVFLFFSIKKSYLKRLNNQKKYSEK